MRKPLVLRRVGRPEPLFGKGKAIGAAPLPEASEMSFLDEYRRRVTAREIPALVFERVRDA